MLEVIRTKDTFNPIVVMDTERFYLHFKIPFVLSNSLISKENYANNF